jgi:hypothetical protein
MAVRAATRFRGASSFQVAEPAKEEPLSACFDEASGGDPSVDGARADDFEGTNLTTDGGRGGAFEADTRENPGDGGGVIGAPRENAARDDEENG